MRRTRVFGPAYLDRVLRVDGPLVDPSVGGPLDQSVDGELRPGRGLILRDPSGGVIEVDLPEDWPGPWGEVRLSRALMPGKAPQSRLVRGVSWQDDLGGMGAGFARAFGGELTCALGPEEDPTSRTISALLEGLGIANHPVRVEGRAADWTLLITSGPHGDKLPIGFRGCHAALDRFEERADASCDLLAVASLTNRLAASALRVPARVRFFAPAMRNMLDRSPDLASFAGAIDVLACNRREWEALEGHEAVETHVSILAVTDGPIGSVVGFRKPDGSRGEIRQPAYPRSRPPVDTNRAGEAFASTLVSALLDDGWSPGPADEAIVRRACLRASAASALVLDRADFGFPTPSEIDEALRAGIVAGSLGSIGEFGPEIGLVPRGGP